MTAAEKALDDAERRELRDEWRRGGGSSRRALCTFQTKRDKRTRRESHAALLRTAIDQLAEPVGFDRWLEALCQNPDLSASNCALVALQTPGEVVYTSAGWHREGYTIRKGIRAAGRITAPGFWPLGYFTASQIGLPHLSDGAVALPSAERSDALRSALTDALGQGVKMRPVLDRIGRLVRTDPERCERQLACAATVDPGALF